MSNYLYNEKKYNQILDNYINGNISDYKKQLGKLSKAQIVYFNSFLNPLGYTVYVAFPECELKIIEK